VTADGLEGLRIAPSTGDIESEGSTITRGQVNPHIAHDRWLAVKVITGNVRIHIAALFGVGFQLYRMVVGEATVIHVERNGGIIAAPAGAFDEETILAHRVVNRGVGQVDRRTTLHVLDQRVTRM